MLKHLFLSAVLCSSANLMAHDYSVGDIKIDHPWARATPPQASVAGVFMTLKSQKGDQLIAAASEAAEKVEIHEMKMLDGVMKMRALPQLPLQAQQAVQLAPGGVHIMLFGLKQSFKEGGKVPMTLTFAKAGQVKVEIKIEAMTHTAESHKH
mgnify:CR=1 FL=1